MTDDGEFEAVERFVRECVARIEGTPYLAPGTSVVFLEELAHEYARVGSRVTVVSAVAAATRLIWPSDMAMPDRRAAVVAMLTESGVMTVVHDEFRFVSESVCRYLRASHIVRRYQKGPRWMSRAAKYLQPRSEWTEQTEEFTRFLITLWWRNTPAATAVARQLAKLLGERHRDPNIFFVAGLCRRGVLAGCDLGERTIAILRDELGSAKRSEGAWRAMAESLRSLDPAAAVVVLENAVRIPQPGMTLRRQFTAATILMNYDPAHGSAHLAYLADHLWGDPADQVAVAALITGVAHDLGTHTLVRLARDPDIGDSRVDAALHVDAPSLWRELIKDQALADPDRLRLLTKLLERDPDTALAIVPTFVTTAHEERTPLDIAELTKDRDPGLAWQLAYDVAWTTTRQVDSGIRLNGILLLGTLDSSQKLELLDRFSAWPDVNGGVRLRAAIIIIEQGGPPTALVNIAHAGDVARSYRKKAAKKLGELDPALGAEAYIALAASCARTDQARLDFLRAAHALVPEPAAEALATVVEDKRFPDEIRVEAVKIARPTLPKPRFIELCSTIAHTAKKDDTALAVARTVKAVNLDAGERLMADLTRRRMPIELRLQAAREAGKHGKHPLRLFAHRSNPPRVRLTAAIALRRIDPVTGDKILVELARTRMRGAGDVRIEAALHLPEPDVLQYLAAIVGDSREDEEVRYDAGVRAVERDEDVGQRALAALAQSRVSRRMQNRITRLLQR